MDKKDKKRDAMVNDIICDFNFEKVHAIIVMMDVKWYGLNGSKKIETPSVDDIIALAREILTEAYDNHKADPEYNGIGKCHLFAEVFKDGRMELTYRPFSSSSFEDDYDEDGNHNDNY